MTCQYPADGCIGTAVHQHGGTLPFTGAPTVLSVLLGIAALCAVLYVLARVNCWRQGGEW
jgi:hypothetical protein